VCERNKREEEASDILCLKALVEVSSPTTLPHPPASPTFAMQVLVGATVQGPVQVQGHMKWKLISLMILSLLNFFLKSKILSSSLLQTLCCKKKF
jgi:hypothetical protein